MYYPDIALQKTWYSHNYKSRNIKSRTAFWERVNHVPIYPQFKILLLTQVDSTIYLDVSLVLNVKSIQVLTYQKSKWKYSLSQLPLSIDISISDRNRKRRKLYFSNYSVTTFQAFCSIKCDRRLVSTMAGIFFHIVQWEFKI